MLYLHCNNAFGVNVMLLSATFKSTGPPPPGLVPISGGTITVGEPTKAATPPVKAPANAPARETDALPELTHSTYKPNVRNPTPPPQSAGGASAFAAHVFASESVAAQPTPQTEEVSLRHSPSAEPLAQRTQAQLSGEELKIVQQLAARDREVRAHENAHVAAAAGITGRPMLSYVTGPDAQRYAVSGEVSIDASGEPGDPEATIAKMEMVKKAALAPAQPSGQDKAVANAAEAKIREAQAEIRAIKHDEEEQAARLAAAKKDAQDNNEAIVPANIQQANAAFSNSAAVSPPSQISLEPLFA